MPTESFLMGQFIATIQIAEVYIWEERDQCVPIGREVFLKNPQLMLQFSKDFFIQTFNGFFYVFSVCEKIISFRHVTWCRC